MTSKTKRSQKCPICFRILTFLLQCLYTLRGFRGLEAYDKRTSYVYAVYIVLKQIAVSATKTHQIDYEIVGKSENLGVFCNFSGILLKW